MTPTEAQGLRDLLLRLYRDEAATAATDGYLNEHSAPAAIDHHTNVFLWYSQYLPERGKILEWGCNHGPDSCLLRHAFADRFELHACDFAPESHFRAFRNYARPQYRQLTSPLGLPYPENTFDVVIASGVLEHTALDLEALKSLYAVLKPNGLLVITYLPYRRSFHEWYLRRIRKKGYHCRLYGWDETDTILKHSGFLPFDLRYQSFVPNLVMGKRKNGLKRLLAPLRYPWFMHAVLCCAARKVIVM